MSKIEKIVYPGYLVNGHKIYWNSFNSKWMCDNQPWRVGSFDTREDAEAWAREGGNPLVRDAAPELYSSLKMCYLKLSILLSEQDKFSDFVKNSPIKLEDVLNQTEQALDKAEGGAI